MSTTTTLRLQRAGQEDDDYDDDSRLNVDCPSVMSFDMREFGPDTGSTSLRPDSDEHESLVHPPNWFVRVGIAITTYIRNHWMALLTSGFIVVVLSAGSVGLCITYFSGLQSGVEGDAKNMAMETATYFGDQLDRATLPLLSLSQFVVELDEFQNLPSGIGAPNQTGSLEYRSETHRNLSSSVCEDPQTMARFKRVAETIKNNTRLQDYLMLLELAPYGVVCLLNPCINATDYAGDHPLSSVSMLGLDYFSESLRLYGEDSIRTNVMSLSGPQKMTIPCRNPMAGGQGGGCRGSGYMASVIEARLPIHISGYQMEITNMNSTMTNPLWGFAIAKIHWNAIVESSGVFENFVRKGFQFQLTRQDRSETGEIVSVVLAESLEFRNRESLGHDCFQTWLVPTSTGENWSMTISYQASAPWRVWVIPLLVILCFCVSYLVYKIILQKQEHIHMKGEARAQESKVETERNMTAYFAHELRNPLSAMDSALKAMPDEDLSGPAKELISGMRLCASFMSSVMNNLLDVRKMEEGQLSLKRIPINMDDLVESLHQMFLPNVRSGVEFLWRSDMPTEESKWVIGDNHRLRQIFTNVITNALKYTTSGSVTISIGWEDSYLTKSDAGSSATNATEGDMSEGPVLEHSKISRTGSRALSFVDTVDVENACLENDDVEKGQPPKSALDASVSPRKSIMKATESDESKLPELTTNTSPPPRIRFECTDTGPGILKMHQKDLFKKFVQRGGAPGTGLGLAISKHLVDLMGGEIYFESDPTVKPGSSCIVLLPLPRCLGPIRKNKKPTAEGKEESNPIQESISLLIVDDIKMNRTMLKRRFQKGIAPNGTISEAPTGELALEMCERESFDVIIMDQFMEDAGGILLGTDTIVALRRMGIQSLIVGCSGNDIDKEFLEAGADLCWQKPMPSNNEIILQINKYLKVSKRR